VTGRRNIIIAISAIVVFAATLGFFITLDVSPQIAYARLFIDAGLVIGLIAVVMAFYRERDLPIDGIIHAINSMKSGKYKTQLSTTDLGPLSGIAVSINELALALEEQQEKQEEIKRNLREELLPSLKQKEPLTFEHSYHPELGPVHTIEDDSPQIKEHFSAREMVKESVLARPPKTAENKLSNTLIESRPPEQPDVNNLNIEKSVFKEQQDLGELYQRFIDAQRSVNLEQIEYPLFLKTIEKTTEDLRSSYKCQGVFFDIVKEAGQVALQPKIIR
jgi:hypothetical protein